MRHELYTALAAWTAVSFYSATDMSSRQEEKERRKAEREAAEAEAARTAARKGRLQLALGGLVAIAAIAVAVLVLGGGGGGGEGGASEPAKTASIPPQRETNLKAAASAAKCKLTTTESEGRDHTTDPKRWIYKTNPPTSGTHHPEWAEDGLYEAGNTPEVGKLVHTLEHGRIDIQYKPGSPKAMIDKLETLGSEALQFGTEGYHVLVFENSTKMEPEVAATAWTHSLTCPTMNDGVYDAIRAFRTEYTDKGPELIP